MPLPPHFTPDMAQTPRPAHQVLGPRPRAVSAHIRDVFVAMTRRTTPVSIWVKNTGLLFNAHALIAIYEPSIHAIRYNGSIKPFQLKHVYHWSKELKCDCINAGDKDEFLLEVVEVMSATFTHLRNKHSKAGL